MGDPDAKTQICIACSKVHSIGKQACECGHVLKDFVASKRERSNKRKFPYTVSPVFPVESKEKIKKLKHDGGAKKIKNDGGSKKSNNGGGSNVKIQSSMKAKSKQSLKVNLPLTTNPVISYETEVTPNYNTNIFAYHQANNKINMNEKNNVALIPDIQKCDILKDIKNSSKNVYYKRSKKYRPAKFNELDFEFDFSLFDSNCPYYPNALADINEKINREQSFWKTIF